ncbi:GR25 family glycosyltransferase involved in LPS biosynthesis [Ancylobacter sp. 3268]|uniref:hypothetical protein n=1 Tax=Ancylobacter sp. 3268 TaxID=2817752 RepID=UPI002858F6EE|nr:hypothetical protein [Ancylobacter sp. 3268]MDR6955859.1 GR25 family glycosyltransferase involved in LPS biosynthesis [Ancylobacter sp. 3268]
MNIKSFNIDHLCFINLDHRTDRLENMQKVLAPCRWPVERISAVRLLSPDQAAGERAHSLNVLSIWKSHRKALTRGLDQLAEGGLIVLEDDIKISRDFFGETLALPASLPDDWEVILYNARFRKHSVVSNGVRMKQPWEKNAFRGAPAYLPEIKKTYICNGAHFCVFRDKATIAKIVETMDAIPQKYHIDSFYGHAFQTYALHSRAIGFADFESDNRRPLSSPHDAGRDRREDAGTQPQSP